jgi:hypothetical protein
MCLCGFRGGWNSTYTICKAAQQLTLTIPHNSITPYLKQSNARFALTVEPDNQALAARKAAIDAARARVSVHVPHIFTSPRTAQLYFLNSSTSSTSALHYYYQNHLVIVISLLPLAPYLVTLLNKKLLSCYLVCTG